jgi:hypothetical protein
VSAASRASGRAHILQETPEVLNVGLGVIALGEAARIVVVQTISVAAAARSRGERDPTRRCKPALGRCAGSIASRDEAM